jgi:K+/H+ antiporter YhaU regulatory subunit KhtT
LPGIPGPGDTIEPGDVVVLYGQEQDAKRLMQTEVLPT